MIFSCEVPTQLNWFMISYLVLISYLKTNIEPENGHLKEEIPFGKQHFQVPAVFF